MIVIVIVCDIGIFELLSISIQELEQFLEPTGVSWCYDQLYAIIDSWRKRNVCFNHYSTVVQIIKELFLQKAQILRLLKKEAAPGCVKVEIPVGVPPEVLAAQAEVPLQNFKSESCAANFHPKRLPNTKGGELRKASVVPGESSSVEVEEEAATEGQCFSNEVVSNTTHVRNGVADATESVQLPANPVSHLSTVNESNRQLLSDLSNPHQPQARQVTPHQSLSDQPNTHQPLSPATSLCHAQPDHANPLPPQPCTSIAHQAQSGQPLIPSFTTIWLQSLLQSTEKGKDIIQRAAQGELSESKQRQLAGIVAKHHLSLNKTLHSDDLERYTLAITTLFKSEKKVSLFKICNYNGPKKNFFSGKLLRSQRWRSTKPRRKNCQ